jgi:signal transduction histidine kinase
VRSSSEGDTRTIATPTHAAAAPAAGRRTPLADLAPRRVSSFGRVAVALGVTALTSVEALPLPAWFAWVGGLVWLPAATWLWFAEEGPANRARTLVGIALDLVALTAVMVLAPDLAPTALLLAIPLAGAATYQGGVRDGLSVVALALLARWASSAAAPVRAVDVVLEVTTGLVGLAVVLLLWWAGAIRRQDARLAQSLADTSDTIMARSAEAIVVTDGAGTIVQANVAAQRVLATTDGGPLVGGGCADRLGLHEAGGRALDCRTGCALAHLCHAAGGDAVEVWRHVGDERQPLLAATTEIRNPHGEVELLHSFRDITRLKQADEAKTMFLATASHELKTPLTVIRGFTQLLQRTATDPESAIALEAIETRSRELAAIVDRLLLSSRIESGHVELAIEPVDLSALLGERLPAFAEGIGCRIDARIAPELVADGSAEAITTVLEQLLDNAAKYSRRQGVVRVTAEALPDGVVIAVRDEGIGMTPDQAELCFGKFWQAESTDVRRFGGTGIGLYIVRSLVEAMGGSVAVSTALGAGSTFTVVLPSAVPAAAPTPRDADAPPEPRPTPGDRTAQPVTVDEFMTQLGIGTGAP